MVVRMTDKERRVQKVQEQFFALRLMLEDVVQQGRERDQAIINVDAAEMWALKSLEENG